MAGRIRPHARPRHQLHLPRATRTLTAVESEGQPQSGRLGLGLSPNPARTALRITWGGVARSVGVFSMDGRLVRVFDRPTGNRLSWNLADAAARRVGSGVYVVRLATDKGTASRQVVVQR